MNNSDNVEVTPSTGNVFADIGLPDPDEAMAKAEIARAISRLIDARRLTQSQAADLLAVDQPKISALVRGRLGGFSLERLVRFLLALDRDVEIVISPKAEQSGRARMRVIARQ